MPLDKGNLFAPAFCEVLNDLLPGWSTDSGTIRGPSGALIRFADRHDGSDGHTDVEFAFVGDDPQSPRIWDCVSGFGATVSERVHSAAHIWGATSATALLELKYSRRGKFADHYHGQEPQGLRGWHCICSPIIGFGRGDSAARLQDWWLSEHLVLPKISPCLRTLADDCPHGIKIFFGGQDIAEVRIDGEVHSEASNLLLSLGWPRLEPTGVLRVFVLALHRE